MRRIVAIASLSLLISAPAWAGTLTLVFDLGGSALGVTSQAPIQFDSRIRSGRMTLRLPSPDGSRISQGPARLESFYLTASFSAMTRISIFDITAYGSAFSSLVGFADGTVTPLHMKVVLPNPGVLQYGFFLGCIPSTICNFYGSYFPVGSIGTLTASYVGTFSLGSPSAPGAASIRGPLISNRSGTVLVTVKVIGNEVSRTFRAPEPALPWLRGAAILAVLVLALRRAPQPVR